MAYLDSLHERVADEQRGRFEVAVEAARIGFLAATSKEGDRRWRSARSKAKRMARDGRGKKGLTGEGLERAIGAIAMVDPGLVKVEQVH